MTHTHMPVRRAEIGRCTRADRPDEPGAPMLVDVCSCGEVVDGGPVAAPRAGHQSVDDVIRRRTQTASATTPDDVAEFYQRRMRGFG